MVAVAAVERKERCLAAVCEMVATSKAVACRGEPDAVGACEWNGPWGHRWLSACIGRRLCPRQADAVAAGVGSGSSNTVDGYRWRTKMMAGSGQLEQES